MKLIKHTEVQVRNPGAWDDFFRSCTEEQKQRFVSAERVFGLQGGNPFGYDEGGVSIRVSEQVRQYIFNGVIPEKPETPATRDSSRTTS